MYAIFQGNRENKEELSIEERSARLMKAMLDDISGKTKPVQNEYLPEGGFDESAPSEPFWANNQFRNKAKRNKASLNKRKRRAHRSVRKRR